MPGDVSLHDPGPDQHRDTPCDVSGCSAVAVWCEVGEAWMTRAVNVLGEIREQLEHELTETGHLATIEQLLADEFEDGAGDE